MIIKGNVYTPSTEEEKEFIKKIFGDKVPLTPQEFKQKREEEKNKNKEVAE